jgi:hypothetical protein
VRTTALPSPEADPAVQCVAQTDDLFERLEPGLRRVIHTHAAAGDEKGVCRVLDKTFQLLARYEPRARFVAPIRSRRNAALVFDFLHDELDLDAVPLSRGRVYQIIAGTLFRWGRARFPALVAWWDGERRDAQQRAARRASRRWARRQAREPAPPPAPPPPTAVPAWLVEAQRPDPDSADWLRILSSVRVVPAPEGPP